MSSGGGDGPSKGPATVDVDQATINADEISKSDSAPATLTVTKEGEGEKESESEKIKTIDFEKLALDEDGDEKGCEDDEATAEESRSKIKDHQLQDDYVDEEALKTEEENLTPEELSERLSKAKTHKDAGNTEFKEEKFKESILSYTKGLLVCPLCEKELRSILYANRAAAKIKLKFQDLAVMDCTKSLEHNPVYMKALIRRAALYEELDKLDEALEDYKKILELDPTYRDAIIATQRLPPLINERNEKLKAEMMGKLKDLGNLVLRPFGLSTENFQLEQQPSGGYSINFKK